MITPFDYQIDCLEKIDAARKQGRTKGFVVMASGLGKTITTALDVQQFERQLGRKARVLFLCHKNEILGQASDAYGLVYGEDRKMGFFHGQNRFGHSADFVFASMQTMAKRHHHFRQDEFDYVVVDESHHSKADTFEKVIRYWRPKFLLGVTATPERVDNRDVRELYGLEVYHLPLETALVRGLLTPVDYRLMSDEIDLERVLGLGKEKRLSISSLNKHIFVPKRDEEIIRIVKEHMATIENPRVIIFCSSIVHADRIAEICGDAAALHSKVKDGERSVRLELFRQGIIPIVTSIDVFNEGVDVPQANLMVFLRSTSSPTIFFQQLGRGLRKSQGKKEVRVLDFAGNCERIRTVQTLQQSVYNEWSNMYGSKGLLEKDRITPQPFILNNEGFAFDEKIVQVLDIVQRAFRNFYPTWQEASQSAIRLGIKNAREYVLSYSKDHRLPSQPANFYPDFPGNEIFLQTGRKKRKREDIYKTWQIASNIAVKLGIISRQQYKLQYKKDPRLPSDPANFYPDFPGWIVFLGKGDHRCSTWQECSEITKALGIQTKNSYQKRYKEGRKLPSCPKDVYSDFPGWEEFLGVKNKYTEREKYATWQEAAEAIKSWGLRSVLDYKKRCKEDPLLRVEAPRFYKDFPGWNIFLGKTVPYETLLEASEAAKKMGIKSSAEYRKPIIRIKDPRLPSHPERDPNFPGWDKFLGRE